MSESVCAIANLMGNFRGNCPIYIYIYGTFYTKMGLVDFRFIT